MLAAKAKKTSRMSLLLMLPMALVATLLVSFSPLAPAEEAYACNAAEEICGNSTSQGSVGGSSMQGPSGGTCGTGIDSNPWQICGWSPISQSRQASNLPENPVELVTYINASTTLIGSFGNDFSGQCLNDRDWYQDPVSGQRVMYQPYGIWWVDNRYWQSRSYTDSYQVWVMKYHYMWYNKDWGRWGLWVPSSNPLSYNWGGSKEGEKAAKTIKGKDWWGWWTLEKETRYYKVPYQGFTDRQVSYVCKWPATPSTKTRLCASDIKFKFEGPYGNANTPWPIYTSVNPNKVDYKTLPRYWYDPPYNQNGSIVYSPIGWQYFNHGSSLGLSNDWQVNYMANCGSINATANFKGKPCKLSDGSTPAGLDCSFTPGNYNKTSDGNSIYCRYAHYPSGTAMPGGSLTNRAYNVSLGCGDHQPSPYGQDHYYGQANWVCDDPAGKVGWNSTANFSDCGSPVPPENCKIVGSTGITSPNGDAVANAAQVAADGKQWKFSFPRLDCPAAQNVWTSFVVVGNNANDGSQPFRWSSPANASDQPVVGDVTPNSTTSILGKNGDIRGVAGSSNQDLYLRFYKATKVANTSINFGNYNGLSNKFTVAKDQATPFGVYIEYHLTLPTDTYTNIGGNAVVNKPIVLKSEMLYVYPTSGRVTG